MSALSVTAEIAGICGGLLLPLSALVIWVARNWVHREIVSKLSNDDTPVAKYAHDARDYSKQALDVALRTHDLVAGHVNNTDIHRVRR